MEKVWSLAWFYKGVLSWEPWSFMKDMYGRWVYHGLKMSLGSVQVRFRSFEHPTIFKLRQGSS